MVDPNDSAAVVAYLDTLDWRQHQLDHILPDDDPEPEVVKQIAVGTPAGEFDLELNGIQWCYRGLPLGPDLQRECAVLADFTLQEGRASAQRYQGPDVPGLTYRW